MSFLENERIQEWLIIINDNIRLSKKFWFYILAGLLVLAVPLFFLLKSTFYKLTFQNYTGPQVNRPIAEIVPLQVIEKKFLKLANNTYSGFIRVKNLNLDWGVPEQEYTAVLKTLGGTEVSRIARKTFILPASEKLIVFSRFNTESEPQVIDLALTESKFLLKPQMSPITLEVSRVEINSGSSELIVSAVVKNASPFTIKQVDLPVALFNRNNEIIGVNFTSISDLHSLETRSFQFFWPKIIPNVVRAEIKPEFNIFDKSIFSSEPGKSPFDSLINEQ